MRRTKVTYNTGETCVGLVVAGGERATPMASARGWPENGWHGERVAQRICGRQATFDPDRHLSGMDPQPSEAAAGTFVTVGADSATGAPDAGVAVTAIYAAHALGLTRLALVMTGDRQVAEDIVHDAFFGLHRRWPELRDTDKALPYVRSAVLNGCRQEFRRARSRSATAGRRDEYLPPAWSAESAVLADEERREVLTALRRMAPRQREALVLRYYLDLSEAETASAMGVSRGTAKSAVARGLRALRQLLGEQS
jgi:RNA polymerase sigma-70 factor (sigma-E family)